MANYTSEEVQAAVSKIVRSTVRHSTGSLGERQVETSFTDLQEAAVGVYILYFNAPYYTLLLGVSRLKDALSTQASTIAATLDAVLATKRSVTPISDLTPLANARAALDALQAAVGARDSGFKDIKAVPAFKQYATNIDAFLTANGGNIKGTAPTAPATPSSSSIGSASSAIVDTPAGARAQIPGLVTLLKAQQDDIVRRVGLLSRALEDFGSLNLPQLSAQNVISNARKVLDQHYQDLAALDENTRLTNLRGVVLDLLAQRPIVETYGAGLDPSQFIATQGLAHAYSDGTHLASAATVVSTKPGPYLIVDSSHFIKVTIDGGAPFEYPLPLGFVAELNGVVVEPYALDTDSNSLSIAFGDPNVPMARRDITLTTGTRTAAQVATELNAGLVGLDLVVERYFRPTKLDTDMLVATTGGNAARFTVLAGGLAGFNLLVGDEVDVLTGPNAGMTLTVNALDPGGLFFDANGPGPVTTVGLPGVSVQVGPAARALRIRDTAPADSLGLRRAIQLPLTGGPSDVASALLGFFPGTSSRSAPVLATDIAANVTGSTSLFNAKAVDLPTYEGLGHGSIIDGTLVVINESFVTGTLSAGTTVTLTASLLEGSVRIGSKAVIRSTETPADLNREGLITAFDEDNLIVSITFATAITGGAVQVETGPALSFGYGAVLTITGGPNQGRYTTREPQGVGTTCSFEMLLDRTMPVPKTGSTVSTFALTFGASYVAFSSPTQSIESLVEVDNGVVGTAAEYFFDAAALPVQGSGATVYLQFDTYPKGAAVGDLVQLFENQYNLISREFSVVGTEPSLRVLALSSSVESAFSMTFDQGVPNPFGAIRIAQTANYGDFRVLIDAWLLRPELTTTYYRDLARFLNPVLSNANPTSAAVDDAAHQLQKLYAITSEAGAVAYGQLSSPAVTVEDTLELALSSYTSPVEPTVAALITSFRNKGADRSIDLLLEGQFSAFFGLDMNTVSYSGALTQAARDLAMNDLPIRKTARRNALGQQLIGTIPNEPNFEFNTSDADSAGLPDIPGAPDVASPGENF